MSDHRPSRDGIRRRTLLGGLLAAAAGAVVRERPARARPDRQLPSAGRERRNKPIWIGHL